MSKASTIRGMKARAKRHKAEVEREMKRHRNSAASSIGVEMSPRTAALVDLFRAYLRFAAASGLPMPWETRA